MAQKPPIGKDAFPVTEEAFRVRADIDLTDFYERFRKETLQQYTDLSQQGYRGEELADRIIAALNELSDRPIEESARGATTEAFNLGRNLEIQKAPALVGEVVRTEILDGNTCEPCRLLDGAVYQVNSPEYFQDMPPNHCDGRDFCRGFYLVRAA
jgi:hypothetical protein